MAQKIVASLVTTFLKKTFYYIGQMISVSLVHGGPSPSFFSDVVVDYIAHGIDGVKPYVMSIPDVEVQAKVKKVTIFCVQL